MSGKLLMAAALLVATGFLVLFEPSILPTMFGMEQSGLAGRSDVASSNSSSNSSSSTAALSSPSLSDAPAGSAVAAGAAAAGAKAATDKHLVPVSLYVMSQCPDAKFCEATFGRVLEPLKDVVDLKMEYIGSIKDQKVSCMHGDGECTGNMHQLCVQAHTPVHQRVPKLLGLINCLWSKQGRIGSKEGLIDCMKEAGIQGPEQSAVLKCVEGEEGAKLQLASAKNVQDNGVQKSCTVFINGKKRCIRDGGSWYDCTGGSEDADFKRSICEAYKAGSNTEAAACKLEPAARRLMLQ
jgi:hypothetical protein